MYPCYSISALAQALNSKHCPGANCLHTCISSPGSLTIHKTGAEPSGPSWTEVSPNPAPPPAFPHCSSRWFHSSSYSHHRLWSHPWPFFPHIPHPHTLLAVPQNRPRAQPLLTTSIATTWSSLYLELAIASEHVSLLLALLLLIFSSGGNQSEKAGWIVSTPPLKTLQWCQLSENQRPYNGLQRPPPPAHSSPYPHHLSDLILSISPPSHPSSQGPPGWPTNPPGALLL